MQNVNKFVFKDTVTDFTTEKEFVLRVSTGIESKSSLFSCYKNDGKFPEYFGNNWDAFMDCLRDFSWIPQRTILIVHNDIPLSNDEGELHIYLELLDISMTEWQAERQGPFAEPPKSMLFVAHELVVVFPTGADETIRRVRSR